MVLDMIRKGRSVGMGTPGCDMMTDAYPNHCRGVFVIVAIDR
jgi:hypothetical protein